MMGLNPDTYIHTYTVRTYQTWWSQKITFCNDVTWLTINPYLIVVTKEDIIYSQSLIIISHVEALTLSDIMMSKGMCCRRTNE